jgi:hypothetical protein
MVMPIVHIDDEADNAKIMNGNEIDMNQYLQDGAVVYP